MSELQKDAAQLLQETCALAEELAADNVRLAEENQKLASKVKDLESREPEVRLQKVAYDQSILNSVLDRMVSLGVLEPSRRYKMAGAVNESPDELLLLTDRLIKFSTPAHSDGFGVKKQGTSVRGTGLPKGDPDAPWWNIIHSGVR